jgi:hypothetical protein
MPRPPASAIWRFASRTLLWLVPCLAGWYALAPFHARPVAWSARLVVDAISRGIVTGLEWSGRTVTFVTDVAVLTRSGERAVLAPELDPLVYTYGAAFFAALALASRMPISRLLLGIVVLLPFQAWGVAFEVLAEVGVKVAPAVAAQAGITGLTRQLVPLGFQLGSLIFPVLVPVVAWAALGGMAPLVQRGQPGSAGISER